MKLIAYLALIGLTMACSTKPVPQAQQSPPAFPFVGQQRQIASNGSILTDVSNQTDYACFYEHKDFKGNYFCLLPGDRVVSLDNKSMGNLYFNDITSSIKIRGNIDVIVNKHWLGDGRDNQIGVLTKSFSDLSKAKRRKNIDGEGYESWNDNISAIAVQKRSDICFYDDVDYNGQEVCLVPGTVIANLSDIDFNDRIKSIKFNHGGFYLEAHIGLHNNFKGEEHIIERDIPDVSAYEGGIFTDGITSIGAFIDGAGPVACPMPKRN